jgi:hypothetical protein
MDLPENTISSPHQEVKNKYGKFTPLIRQFSFAGCRRFGTAVIKDFAKATYINSGA